MSNQKQPNWTPAIDFLTWYATCPNCLGVDACEPECEFSENPINVYRSEDMRLARGALAAAGVTEETHPL